MKYPYDIMPYRLNNTWDIKTNSHYNINPLFIFIFLNIFNVYRRK